MQSAELIVWAQRCRRNWSQETADNAAHATESFMNELLKMAKPELKKEMMALLGC